MCDDSDKLASLRKQIDELDAQLLELMGRRLSLVKQAGQFKQANDLPALDEERWKQATEKRLEQARTLGLPENLISDMYEMIHSYTLQMERDLGAK
jgi:chorismate mutase